MNLTHTLLLLFVASVAATIMANQIPGTWWQWALVSTLLLISAAVASVSDEEE